MQTTFNYSFSLFLSLSIVSEGYRKFLNKTSQETKTSDTVVSIVTYTSDQSTCDLKSPSNIDFNKFYSIENNPFATTKKSEQRKSFEPFFEPIFKDYLKSPSMIVLGDQGVGKTHFKNYRLAKLDDSSSTLVVKIFINHFLEIFYENIKFFHHSRNPDFELIFPDYFNSNDFIHIMIAELVHTFISQIETNRGELAKSLKAIGFDERFRIACILSFFSRSHQSLKKIVREDFLFDMDRPEPNKNLKFSPEIALLHAKIRIFDNEQKKNVLNELGQLNNGDLSTPANVLDDSPDRILNKLCNFLKTHLNKKILFVVDSIEEITYLFNSLEDKKKSSYVLKSVRAMQKLVDSIVTDNVLSMAASTSDSAFDIFVFLPLIHEIEIDKWKHTDKIPVVRINWDAAMLKDYANFILDFLAKQMGNGMCRPMATSFDVFLGGNSAMALEVIKSPRDLNRFMQKLIQIMNSDQLRSGGDPFIARKQDVQAALEELKTRN